MCITVGRNLDSTSTWRSSLQVGGDGTAGRVEGCHWELDQHSKSRPNAHRICIPSAIFFVVFVDSPVGMTPALSVVFDLAHGLMSPAGLLYL
jgi:hypothetical protein